MKVKLVSIMILLLLIHYRAKSQIDTNQISQNLLYLECLGIGGYGSFNYERIMLIKKKKSIGLRIGISTYRIKDYTTKFNPDIMIPVTISRFYGNKHKIELGFGQTISSIVQANHSNWEPERVTNLNANFTIGYRYQKDKGGFLFRASYTPLIEFYRYYRHWGGISIGYAF